MDGFEIIELSYTKKVFDPTFSARVEHALNVVKKNGGFGTLNGRDETLVIVGAMVGLVLADIDPVTGELSNGVDGSPARSDRKP